jgi:hypothetical protein
MLLLRIFLILAILAGIGVIAVNQAVLKPQIEEIIRVRNENEKKWHTFEDKAKKLDKDLKETQGVLNKTKGELETKTAQLADATAKAESEQKRANDLQKNLDSTKTALKTAQEELAAWTALGIPVNEVKGMIDTVKSQKLALDGLTEENGLFRKQIKDLKKRIRDLTSTNPEDPPVPPEIRGKVMVVDPKWNFLVLNVGKKQGVPDRGVLLVSRDGLLVAKVRVMSSQDDRSIANIMPGWKLKDVMEGDYVLPYNPNL